MKKRIVCTLLLFITLFSFAVPVFANTSKESVDLSQTTVEEDLQASEFDIEAYKSRYENTAQLITIREYGYTNGRSTYDLYLYIYLPEMYNVFISRATISVNGSGVEIEYVNKYDGFYKFRLSDISPSDYQNGNVREYSFDSSIGLYYYADDMYWQDGIQLEEYVGFSFSTPVWFKCSGLDSKDTYSIESNVQDLITLDVKHTVYRTPTSEKGVYYHHDIFSVYFSVPNKYFEEYEYLKSIDIRYIEAVWNAIVASDDKVISEAKKLLRKDFDNGFDSSCPSVYVRPYIMYSGILKFNTAAFHLNNQSSLAYSKELPGILNVLKVSDYKDDDLFISGNDISNYFSYDENGAPAFRNQITVEFDDTFDIESFESGNKSPQLIKNLISWFYNYHDEVSLSDVDPIVSVDDSFFNGFTSDNEKWCADHLINPDDADAFKAAYNTAKSKEETLVVLRFAVRDYYAAPTAVDTGYKWTSLTNSFYAQGTGFRNFRVINLNFMKKGEVYIVPVYHEALDINGGITGPQDTILEDLDEEIDDWWKKLMEDYNNTLEGVLNAVRILMLLMLVVVLWQPVSMFVTLIINMFVSRKNKNKKE